MVRQVRFLVSVEEVGGSPAKAAAPAKADEHAAATGADGEEKS
jgi:hypothetical protein